MADDEPLTPEEDPEAALEALAEGSAPKSPARRRRLARAALLASYCKAVGDVQSGDARDMTVLTGPGRRRQTVSVEFD